MTPVRSMAIFVSDIHLTDALEGASVPHADTFRRFWTRIDAARGERPATLVFVGDLFDLVRSPRWLASAHRPYHDASRGLVAMVDEIVAAILGREAPFFDAIRAEVERGRLAVRYVLGNHDRLLAHAPRARATVRRALGMAGGEAPFPVEEVFPDHGVLAYHGHASDLVNFVPGGAPTLGDAIGCELIVRFPRAVREVVPGDHPALDDIDDVRPIYAVPAWVRHLGTIQPALLRPIGDTWSAIVEDFLSKPFVRDWMRRQHRVFGLDAGKKLRLMLELSTRRVMVKGQDQRLTQLYRVVQHTFDGRMAAHGAERLAERGSRGLRYVVNGHSHFPSMVPLGRVHGQSAVYFNTGTWRRVHQIGHDLGGRPSFLPYEAMTYLVFFPAGDPLGRDYEWWTGAMVSARAARAAHGA